MTYNLAHQTERYDRYQQVVNLHKQGMKIREIAGRLRMGQRTVQSWLAHNIFDESRSKNNPDKRRIIFTEKSVFRKQSIV